MKKLVLRVVVILAVVLVVALVVVVSFLGSIVKKGVVTVGPTITKTPVHLDGASVSLFSGKGTLSGFVLGNPPGFKSDHAIKVGRASLGVQPKSLFGDKVHITHVRVEAPEITFETEGLNVTANNLSRILDNVSAAAGETKSTSEAGQGAARKLQVDDFLIAGARLHVTSSVLGGREVTVVLPDIHMSQLGQGPEGITAAELTRRILNDVVTAAIPAAQQALSSAVKGVTDAVKDLGKGSNTLEKVTRGVGDLLKKK